MESNINVTVYCNNKKKTKEIRNIYTISGKSLWDFEDIHEQDGATNTMSIYTKFYDNFDNSLKEELFSILNTMDENEYTITFEGDDSYETKILGNLYPNSYFEFSFYGDFFQKINKDFKFINNQNEQTFIIPIYNLNNLKSIKNNFKNSKILLEEVTKLSDVFIYVVKTENMKQDITEECVILKMNDDGKLVKDFNNIFVNYDDYTKSFSLCNGICLGRYFQKNMDRGGRK